MSVKVDGCKGDKLDKALPQKSLRPTETPEDWIAPYDICEQIALVLGRRLTQKSSGYSMRLNADMTPPYDPPISIHGVEGAVKFVFLWPGKEIL
jgi:hypothetical protein